MGAPVLAFGQASVSAQSASPAVPPPCCVIPAGSLVIVELTESVGSDTSKSGDGFGLRLAEPIVVQGRVVAPVGMTGRGEVVDAKPAGMGGRPGRLVLAAGYLQSGALRIPLQSLKLGSGGQDNSGLAVGATFAVGIVGALITGGGVEYPAGMRATAKVAIAVSVPQPSPPATRPPPSIAEP